MKRSTAVFVVPGPAAARLVVKRTAIPVVAIGLVPTPVAGEPYGSLARPGGSVTGFSTIGEELSGKRIELLRRALPRMTLLFGDRRARRSLAVRTPHVCSERVCIRAIQWPTAMVAVTAAALQVRSP